jgi:two-component system chemotaxis sensor kinase CheA
MNEADDILQDYFAECREHLDGIENDLLAIEQAGGEADSELVNKVFRAAHSIKGGAGFFDLADIRELAHKTENVLDLIRSRQAAPSTDLVGILLQAFDKLRELIDQPAHRDPEGVPQLVHRLEDVVAACLPQRRKNSVRRSTPVVTPERETHVSATAFDFDSARHAGKLVYLLEYDLLHDLQSRDLRPLEVLKQMMSYGSILDVAVDVGSVGTLDESPSNRLPMDILYATALGPELIGSVLDAPAGRIWKVHRNGSCEALSGCESWAPAPPAAGEQTATEQAGEPAQPAPEEAPETAAPAPAPEPAPPPEKAEAAGPPAVEATVRLNVTLLDTLMNLAGELVLGRNQLGDAISRGDPAMIQAANQRISVVTSEVQEAVMRTRMQPVGNLFQKFPRLVRDTARQLGKEVRLVEEGSDVELDKTIIEGLSDPLTHMVRNAIDHGIESPADRAAAGKPPQGILSLRAWHEAGLVVVEVADDGRGLDAEQIAAAAVRKGMVSAPAAAAMTQEEKLGLIFLAGVSTARRISDISGRGVGLDVVKSNLDRLGGKIEIESRPGRGTAFRIKLPLTLAIIPSLLVQSGGDPIAIPLVNVQELVRIPAAEIGRRIDRVGTAEVLILRDGVLPLVHLDQGLDLPAREAAAPGGEAWNVVVLSGGAFHYGLVVERLHGTVEIVVKPLGRHLKHLGEYAGATILGDGGIALILDVAGLAAVVNLKAADVAAAVAPPEPAAAGDVHNLLLFRNASEHCALPLHAVSRVLKVRPEEVERVGGRRTMQHRGRSLPLVALADLASVDEVVLDQTLLVVVVEDGAREFGLLGAGPVDVVEAAIEIDPRTLRQPGVMGSTLLRGRTTLVLDTAELAESAWPGSRSAGPAEARALAGVRVLVVEDSAFFREHLVRTLEGDGATVFQAPDGQAGWEWLESHAAEVGLVVTDVEMPRLDGLELTRRIRARSATARLPVLMLTALAGEEDVRRGREVGASDYCIKLDQAQLLARLRALVGRAGDPHAAGGLGRLARRLEDEAGYALPETVRGGERK